MLRRERERTEEANRRADEAWEQLAMERKRSSERIEALISQANEERRLAEERLAEERRQSAETHQAMMATIAELTSVVAELRQRNGTGIVTDTDQ